MTHGSPDRLSPLAPRSPLYQGPFGRLFPDLDPWRPEGTEKQIDKRLLKFANEEMLEYPGDEPGDIDETAADDDFGSGIPAAYTYFAQFVDHDITFDTASSLERESDPNGLINFRTPRFDLDNLYGRGGSDQPYMYDGDEPGRAKMLIGEIGGTGKPDLPRNAQGRALIGDMRNDENAMVSQLQLAFLMAHNELVDRARAADADDAFESARKTLRWLYQWVVWNDFVKRIVLDDVWARALTPIDDDGLGLRWRHGLSHVYDWKNQPYMPIEFSGAAYRFGHSMVRNAYKPNNGNSPDEFVPIFSNTVPEPRSLKGFRPMQVQNTIQWDRFLEMETSDGPEFPLHTRRIDTRLSNALAFLHETDSGDPENVLAFRNLKRSLTYQLPAGSAVARQLGVEPVTLAAKEPDALWFYILREAEEHANGQSLGRVGSMIVAGTFAGLLHGDPRSWINLEPGWTPGDDPLLRPGDDNVDTSAAGEWTLAAIIRLSGLPTSDGDF